MSKAKNTKVQVLIEYTTPLHFSATLSGSWENDVKCDTSKESHKKDILKRSRSSKTQRKNKVEELQTGHSCYAVRLGTQILHKMLKLSQNCPTKLVVWIFDVNLQFLHFILFCKKPSNRRRHNEKYFSNSRGSPIYFCVPESKFCVV